MFVNVRTVNDSFADFAYLFRLWKQIEDGLAESKRTRVRFEVTFDFSRCGFLRPNAVAFLGGVARMIQHRSGSVSFEWNSLADGVYQTLDRNGFLRMFGGGSSLLRRNAIPYREDARLDVRSLVPYLENEWLDSNRGVALSQALRSEIAGKVVEIYVNAFEHSQSPIGVTSCGQHYPRMKETKLTVVDFGLGIPRTIRRFLRKPRMPVNEALRWAFQSGNTTKPTIGRGMGLELLRSFVQANDGKLEILSHDGYVLIDKEHEQFSARTASFPGTVVNITLKCDERYYYLDSEADDEPLF